MLARYVHNDRLVDPLMSQAQSALQASPDARILRQATRNLDHNPALRERADRLVGICLVASTQKMPLLDIPAPVGTEKRTSQLCVAVNLAAQHDWQAGDCRSMARPAAGIANTYFRDGGRGRVACMISGVEGNTRNQLVEVISDYGKASMTVSWSQPSSRDGVPVREREAEQ